jgi:ankyrin repeat protein
VGKNFEIVGKHEQRKALLALLENDELRFEVLKTMVKAGCSITERYPDLDNGSALFFTAFSGSKEACKVLLKLGADPNVLNDNGWTAAMIAASQGKSNAMRILVEGGADMEVKVSTAELKSLMQ